MQESQHASVVAPAMLTLVVGGGGGRTPKALTQVDGRHLGSIHGFLLMLSKKLSRFNLR